MKKSFWIKMFLFFCSISVNPFIYADEVILQEFTITGRSSYSETIKASEDIKVIWSCTFPDGAENESRSDDNTITIKNITKDVVIKSFTGGVESFFNQQFKVAKDESFSISIQSAYWGWEISSSFGDESGGARHPFIASFKIISENPVPEDLIPADFSENGINQTVIPQLYTVTCDEEEKTSESFTVDSNICESHVLVNWEYILTKADDNPYLEIRNNSNQTMLYFNGINSGLNGNFWAKRGETYSVIVSGGMSSETIDDSGMEGNDDNSSATSTTVDHYGTASVKLSYIRKYDHHFHDITLNGGLGNPDQEVVYNISLGSYESNEAVFPNSKTIIPSLSIPMNYDVPATLEYRRDNTLGGHRLELSPYISTIEILNDSGDLEKVTSAFTANKFYIPANKNPAVVLNNGKSWSQYWFGIFHDDKAYGHRSRFILRYKLDDLAPDPLASITINDKVEDNGYFYFTESTDSLAIEWTPPDDNGPVWLAGSVVSGIGGYAITVQNVNGNVVYDNPDVAATSITLNLNSTGILPNTMYTITITPRDKAGNIGNSITKSFVYAVAKPSISFNVTNINSSSPVGTDYSSTDSRLINASGEYIIPMAESAAYKWTINDEGGSGLVDEKHYSVSRNGVAYDCSLEYGSLILKEPGQYTITLTAQDVAGNISTKVIKQIISTNIIAVQGIVGPEVIGSGSARVYNVRIILNQTSPEFVKTAFASITFSRNRDSLPTGIVGLEKEFTVSTDTIILENGLLVSKGSPWVMMEYGDDAYLCYIDTIPVSTGVGHKKLKYELVSALTNIGQAISINQYPVEIEFINTEGGISYKDSPGFGVHDAEDIPYGDAEFSVGSNREVDLVFTARDYDRESWSLDVYGVTILHQSDGGSIKNYKEMCDTRVLSLVDSSTGVEVNIPITLSEGSNYIQIFWKEGDDNQAIYHTEIVNLELISNNSEGYTLKLQTDGFQQTVSSQLVCSPWQPLQFELSFEDQTIFEESITWKFGDESEYPPEDPSVIHRGYTMSHSYRQKAEQTEDHCIYKLTISIVGREPIEIEILVQDTKIGMLWGNEIWRGPHTIAGVVVVPEGKELKIESGPVTFSGSTASGYMQGIKVEENGTLSVLGGVSFEANDDNGWGCIFIEGNATIGSNSESAEDVTICGADRGIVVVEGATLSMYHTSLVANNIGLHVLGENSSVIVDKCTFSNNGLYGVKEDAGAQPLITNSDFKKSNFRNYYQDDEAGGVLTSADDINSIGSNSNNTVTAE